MRTCGKGWVYRHHSCTTHVYAVVLCIVLSNAESQSASERGSVSKISQLLIVICVLEKLQLQKQNPPIVNCCTVFNGEHYSVAALSKGKFALYCGLKMCTIAFVHLKVAKLTCMTMKGVTVGLMCQIVKTPTPISEKSAVTF